jgi:hypothetical protein
MTGCDFPGSAALRQRAAIARSLRETGSSTHNKGRDRGVVLDRGLRFFQAVAYLRRLTDRTDLVGVGLLEFLQCLLFIIKIFEFVCVCRRNVTNRY